MVGLGVVVVGSVVVVGLGVVVVGSVVVVGLGVVVVGSVGVVGFGGVVVGAPTNEKRNTTEYQSIFKTSFLVNDIVLFHLPQIPQVF